MFFVLERIDPAFLHTLPTADPVGDVQLAVAAEVEVGCQDVPDRLLFVFELPACTVRSEFETADAADWQTCHGSRTRKNDL